MGKGSNNSLNNSINSGKPLPKPKKRKESIKIERPASGRSLVISVRRDSPESNSRNNSMNSNDRPPRFGSGGSNRSFGSNNGSFVNSNSSYIQPRDKYEMTLPRY